MHVIILSVHPFYNRFFKKCVWICVSWELNALYGSSAPFLPTEPLWSSWKHFWTLVGKFCQWRVNRPGGTNPSAVLPVQRQRASGSTSFSSWRDVELRIGLVSDLPLIQASRWEDPFMSVSWCTHTPEIWYFQGLKFSRQWKHDTGKQINPADCPWTRTCTVYV